MSKLLRLFLGVMMCVPEQPEVYLRRVPTFIADWSRVLQQRIADFFMADLGRQ